MKHIGATAGIALTITALASTAAVQAGQTGLAGNARTNVVNITYMLWDPNEEVGYKKSIAVFEKAHPNIHVTVQQLDWNHYWQKLQTNFAAGDAPDVFWDHAAYFPAFVSQNQLMNLTPYIKKDHINLKQYYPSLLGPYQYNGGQYGLPKDWDTIAFFYNKDLFRKLKIAFPTNLTWNPTTGGTFLKLAQELTVDKKGKHPNQKGFDANNVVRYGMMSYNSNQSFYYNFIASNGGKFIDKPFGQKLQLDSPQATQAMQFVTDLINKYHVSPPGTEGITPNGSTNAQTDFYKGKVAMYTDGDWNLTTVTQNAKFHVGVGLLPIGPSGRWSVMNGLSDAIYAKTKHPQEAWELVKWLASPQSESILASGGYVWPGIPSEAPLFAKAWAKKGVDVTPFLTEAAGKTISFPITTNWSQASSAIDQEFNLLWLGKVDAKTATATAVQQGDSALAQG